MELLEAQETETQCILNMKISWILFDIIIFFYIFHFKEKGHRTLDMKLSALCDSKQLSWLLFCHSASFCCCCCLIQNTEHRARYDMIIPIIMLFHSSTV